ncbi:nitrile hydratase accessory protein [Streptomyces sp. Inha503]|uniref:nitrile hydratase accessory protein n=1 Tax=Streptomyces sp. Inha503 TaxID=3383314 RepID=UPI0039A28A4B
MTAPLDIEGPAAPPRSNGELVFAEPWEGRAFAMAVSLYEAGAFPWPRFQAALIARIAARETAPTRDEPFHYYRLWLAALEDVLVGLRVVATDEVSARTHALARRHPGHDHRDDHDHVSERPSVFLERQHTHRTV